MPDDNPPPQDAFALLVAWDGRDALRYFTVKRQNEGWAVTLFVPSREFAKWDVDLFDAVSAALRLANEAGYP
jgi:hypothetical protein